MKEGKKVNKGIMLLGVILVLALGTAFIVFSQVEEGETVLVSDINDGGGVMKLDFSGANVLVLGCKKDKVEVVPSIEVEESGVKPELEYDGNVICLKKFERGVKDSSIQTKLKEWKSLLKSEANKLGYDFTVFVPKDVVVSVIGNNVRVEKCIVSKIEAEDAVIRNSDIQKGFVSTAKVNKVRDCKIDKDSTFEGELEERDNTYKE